MIDMQNQEEIPILEDFAAYIPREGYFTVLVVIGSKVKEAVENILCDCAPELRELYEKTRWGNGQKWLMIDLEDQGEMFADVLQLIEIRRG